MQRLNRRATRPRSMAFAALVASCLVAAACGQGAPAATPQPLEQSLGPSLSPQPSSPAWLAEPRTVPTGWTLQRSVDEEPGPPAVWARVYSAAAVPDTGPLEGPGRLVVYQAFGLSDEWTGTGGEKMRARGAEQFPVSVNGQGQTLWHDPSSGELLLGWTLDGKSLALVGNAADMSAAQLVEIAQGFVPAP